MYTEFFGFCIMWQFSLNHTVEQGAVLRPTAVFAGPSPQYAVPIPSNTPLSQPFVQNCQISFHDYLVTIYGPTQYHTLTLATNTKFYETALQYRLNKYKI